MVISQSLGDSATQSSFFSATAPAAVQQPTAAENAGRGLLGSLHHTIQVSCSVHDVGKGFAVVLVVVVKLQGRVPGATLRLFGYNLANVKRTLHVRNLMAKKH